MSRSASAAAGINDIATIVRAAVDYWKQSGMHPFIIPAMGSHGAATAEGQAAVLAHYGVDEAKMGCPVISQLEVVSLGKTEDNIEAFMDRAAYEADGVMLINRTKWHTDFSGKIESGLFKMMAIGLGKFAGARRYHTYGYKLGLEHVIRSVGRLVLKSGKIVGGLAILEDAYHHTAKLDAVTAGNMEQREQENLALATLLDGDDSGRSRRSHPRRNRQAHQRWRHGLEGREPRLRSRAQSVSLRAPLRAHFHSRSEPAQLWQRDRIGAR